MNTGSQKTQMEAKAINYQKLLAFPLAMVMIGTVFIGSALASTAQDVADNACPINSLVNEIVVNSAAEQATNNSQGSSYNITIVVITNFPERLKVYKNGFVIFTALVNTGVPAAPTPYGTFYVYKKLVTRTMSGTNPDGSHYSDPGVPWVMYFYYGCAIHGFVRSHYGFAQSVGCVEMRPSKAQRLFPLIPVGTKVIIE
jgi:lipoprotein-anchoring transpeptidase ErfK/SrfK